MDNALGKKTCYVHFPQRFDGIDRNDRYANRNTVFFDVSIDQPPICTLVCNYAISLYFQPGILIVKSLQITLRGFICIQGPIYVGTWCCFNRQALYGYGPVLSEKDLEPTCFLRCCRGYRKKRKRENKGYADDKKRTKRTEYTIPIFSFKDIEEVLEGEKSQSKPVTCII